ncbi:ATP-binding protein [Myxococcota bacterium]|nr:ATP-binding protein [Myxococcota bacterium]
MPRMHEDPALVELERRRRLLDARPIDDGAEDRTLAIVEQRLAVQHEISRALARTSSLEESVHGVLRVVREGLGLSVVALWLPDASGSTLRCFDVVTAPDPALTPFVEATRTLAFAPGHGLPGRVWKSEHPAWIGELAADPDFARLAAAERGGLRTGVATPLLAERGCVGVLEWFCREPAPQSASFLAATGSIGTEIVDLTPSASVHLGLRVGATPSRVAAAVDDFAFLLGVANVLSASIQRASAERTLESATERFEATYRRNGENLAFLADLGDAFAAAVTATDVARIAAEKIARYFGTTRVNFSDVSATADEITVFFSRHDDGLKDDHVTHRLSDYLAPDLVAELQAGHTVAIDDVRLDPRTRGHADAYVQWDIGSMMLAPFVSDGRWKFVVILHKGVPYAWRPDELEMLREVSARVHLRIERARTDEALREADRRKDEFLAMLAHELRNPLAPIRNAAHLLRRVSPAQPHLDAAREMIERQVGHLVRLVDDLLDVSRVSRGRIKLQKEPIELGAVVAQAIETVRPLIEARGHTLTVTVPASPVRLDGDFTRLAQVVSNILNNAAKYTDDGGRISVSLERADDGPTAILRVCDDGRGIDPSMLDSVFELFFQVDRNLDRSEGGLGIGLSLVKNLVELHGGRVHARSEGRGRGTELVVELPCHAADPPTRRTEPSAIASGAPRLRVLVVDDNRDAAESMAMLLELDGHEALTAHDGQRAVEVALAERPPIVLLDIGLPKLNGYEACRAMRAGGLDRALIIALTGYGQDDDRRRSKEAGFDCHLVKPADLGTLRQLITQHGE